MKEFAAILDNNARRHDFPRVFDDFLTATVAAYCFGNAEDDYENAMRGYEAEERNDFGRALGAMALEYTRRITPDGGWADPIGDFFEEHNSRFGASARGQFFTPASICRIMAMMTNGEEEPEDGVTVADPACGSGRNLIAHARLHPSRRTRNFYTGQDVDIRCARMCVINFVMYGMRGVVMHMDTLAMKVYRGWRVYLPETGMGVHPLNEAQCAAYLFTTKGDNATGAPTGGDRPAFVPPVVHTVGTPAQLTLF